jgi:ABC-2 type transport system permease protein
MTASWQRIWAMTLRYLYLHRRSWVRNLSIGFWPVMDLLIWGYVTLYIRQVAGLVGHIAVFFVGAMIFWDIHYRVQQGVTLSLMEEVWTRNIINVLISPLRLWEWVAATCLYSLMKVAGVVLVLGVLAQVLYAFRLTSVGWVAVPLAAQLLVFGWAIGIVTAGLLLRFGYAAEMLIWAIPFLIQPFSAVFYPVSVLPAPAQAVSRILPTTYVFEGLRMVLQQGRLEPSYLVWATALNLVYVAVGAAVFIRLFRAAQASGRLSRLGQE